MELKIAKVEIEVVTGLHIGGSDSMMKIGGVDSEVIKRSIKCNENGNISLVGKHTIDEPYIPGSSIKGKLRSLLEHKYNYHEIVKFVLDEFKNKEKLKEKLEEIKGEVTNFKRLEFLLGIIDDYDGLADKIQKKFEKFNRESFEENIKNIIKLFGSTDDFDNLGISRLIIRDFFITNEIRKKYIEKEIEIFEEKTENVIDRITGRVKKGGVRTIERVVPGVVFEGEIVLRLFEEDNEKDLKNLIKEGFELLENDCLGGSGSRGYGKVKLKEEINFNGINQWDYMWLKLFPYLLLGIL